MLKLLLVVIVLAGAALAVTSLPLRGRTVLDRWQSAPSATAFVERGWGELKAAVGLAPGRSAVVRPQPPRSSKPASSRPARPTEQLSEQDRAALDRLIVERAGR